MTVSITNLVKTYTGNDASTVFAYDFFIPTASEVIVEIYDTVTETTTVLNTSQYSITGVGDAGFGNVTYPLSGDPLTTTEKITIRRSMTFDQGLALTNQTSFLPETLEDELDAIVFMLLELKERTDRVILGFPGETFDTVLPPKATLANKVPSFDGDGNPTYSDNPAVSATAAAASAAAAAASVTNAASSATAASNSATSAASSAADALSSSLLALAAQQALDLPTISGGDAGKGLKVNSGETAYEFDTSIAHLDAVGIWAAVQGMDTEIVAYTASWTPDLTDSPWMVMDDISGSLAINLPTGCDGSRQHFVLEIHQDATGSRAITENAGFVGDITWSTGADEVDVVLCVVVAQSGGTATKVIMSPLYQGAEW